MKKILFIFVGSLLVMGGCQKIQPGFNNVMTPQVTQQTTQENLTAGQQTQLSILKPQPVATLPPPASKPIVLSGIRGTATLGPTCPVERIPPDPMCADKPYAALLNFSTQNGILVKQLQVQSNGSFEVVLSAGVYVISQAQGKIYPRLSPQTVTVKLGQFTSIHLQFDSGIR